MRGEKFYAYDVQTRTRKEIIGAHLTYTKNKNDTKLYYIQGKDKAGKKVSTKASKEAVAHFGASSAKASGKAAKKGKSPARRSKSPAKKGKSPKRKSKSPAKKAKSPKRKSKSPAKKAKSPKRKSPKRKSPKRKSASPKRKSTKKCPPGQIAQKAFTQKLRNGKTKRRSSSCVKKGKRGRKKST